MVHGCLKKSGKMQRFNIKDFLSFHFDNFSTNTVEELITRKPPIFPIDRTFEQTWSKRL